MKRRDLIKLLEQNGWYYLRDGGRHDIYTNGVKGSSKNLMSFRCAVDLVGRLHNNFAGILTYVKKFCAI